MTIIHVEVPEAYANKLDALCVQFNTDNSTKSLATPPDIMSEAKRISKTKGLAFANQFLAEYYRGTKIKRYNRTSLSQKLLIEALDKY